MSIKDKLSIDVIGAMDNTLCLFIYDDQSITEEDELIKSLEEKLDNYLYYISKQEYRESYGDMDKFLIIVELREEISEKIENYFESINEKILEKKDIDKEVLVKYQFATNQK